MRIQGLNLPFLENNDGGGGGGDPPTTIDNIGDSILALSVRKIISTYSGSCLRVRRASDDTEQDIGFDGSGDLDTASISSFCGASVGFVVTWYDQSTTGADVTQATFAAQPEIYDGVAVLMSGGHPALFFRGDSLTERDKLSSSTLPPLTDLPSTDRPWHVYTVSQQLSHTNPDASRGTVYQYGPNITVGLCIVAYRPQFANNLLGTINGVNTSGNVGESTFGNSAYIMATHDELSTPINAIRWKNALAFSNSTSAPTDTIIGSQSNIYVGSGAADADSHYGYISEVVMFDGNKDADISSMETYIEGYYTIDP